MEKLFKVEGLCQYYPLKKEGIFTKKRRFLKANDAISLDIYEGEVLSLVGESGSGKSTFGRTLLRLAEPTAGKATYRARAGEVDLFVLSHAEMRPLRRELQMIFQDPYSSLNPRMTVGQTIAEGLLAHGLYRESKNERRSYILDVLARSGLSADAYDRYPHQFSGGQRQRISIARALSFSPRFVVCDECVSALDVSIRAQILNLLCDLREREGLTYLFISHDLSVVRYLSDRVGVLYLGRIVELAACEALFSRPLHPYTRLLLSAIPSFEMRGKREAIKARGLVASREDYACPFYPRCERASERCRYETPPLLEVEKGHFVACHWIG